MSFFHSAQLVPSSASLLEALAARYTMERLSWRANDFLERNEIAACESDESSAGMTYSFITLLLAALAILGGHFLKSPFFPPRLALSTSRDCYLGNFRKVGTFLRVPLF